MINYCEQYWDDIEETIRVIPNINKIKNCTIMVTGATGMICSSIVDLLFLLNARFKFNMNIILAGRNLEHVKKRFYLHQQHKDYEFVYYDATIHQEMNINADYVIHGASNANPSVYLKQPTETMLSNIIGLNDVLSMSVQMNVKRVLFISSSEVYGTKEDEKPFSEEDYGYVDILNPRACYPSAKRAAETLCVSYYEQHRLDTVIVRPGHIFGPTITASDTRASAEFTRNAYEGKDIVMKSKGMQLRSYCFCMDCTSAVITVLLNGKSGEAYNISNRNSVISISDLSREFSKCASTSVIYQEATLSEKTSFNMMDNSSLNSLKLEQLGWRALFDLASGVKKTLQYYKEIVE